MKYERFSQLWDALVTNRPESPDVEPISNGMTIETSSALIAYANGDKGQIESVTAFLEAAPEN